MSPHSTGGLQRLLDWLGVDVGAALDEIGFPAAVVDAGGAVRWLNAAAVELLGDVVGLRYLDLIAPEAAHRARREFTAKLLGTKTRSDYPLAVRDRSGRQVRLAISTVPLHEDGRVVGVFGVGYPFPSASEEGVAAERLTPRQREVLALLAAGRTTRDIAAELGISEETVRNHVRHLLRRLGARTRLAAVVEARKLGLDI